MSPLNPDLEARYKLTLANAAKELTIGESLPIDVERICAKLQIKHERKINDYKTARLEGKSCVYLPSLLLPYSGYYSAQERYWIAHEIGHYILANLCSAAPLGRSEYWQFENLCDDFARQLLIPKDVINRLPESITSPKEALKWSSDIAKDTFVPWPTAAWRITELHPEFAMLNVTMRTRQGQLALRINASTLARKQLQKKVLNTQIGLGLILRPLTQGENEISFCDTEKERAKIMEELPALGEVIGANAIRSSGGNIRVAFMLKQ